MIRVSEATKIITVNVDPAKVPGRVGKNVQFDIYISGIEESVYDLWTWGLKLTWADIEFNLVSVEEGDFLKQTLSGETNFLSLLSSSGGFETLSLASTVKWDPQYGNPRGVLGEGVLVKISLYVIAGTTGSRFEISDIELRNSGPSATNQIWPPVIPPGLEAPLYDVIVLDEAGEFIRAQKPEDIEPTYGVIDAYDLGVVAANYDLNVVRSRKISTSWAPDPTASWDNPQNLGASDELRALTKTDGANTTWMNFMFNTTEWIGVQKVEVGLETWTDYKTDNIVIALSNDNGTSWSSTTYTYLLDAVNWEYPERVMTSDDSYCSSKTDEATTRWRDFGFDTSGWTGVTKVEVGLERKIASETDNIVIRLSNDNGTTWSPTTYTDAVSQTTDTMVWFDVTLAYTWTPAMVRNIAAALTYEAVDTRAMIDIDYLAIRVTPTSLLATTRVPTTTCEEYIAKLDRFVWIDVTSAYSWTMADIRSIAVGLIYEQVSLASTIRIDYLVVAVTPQPVKSLPDAFDPDADVNNDRVVDITDLGLVAVNYGSYSIEEEE